MSSKRELQLTASPKNLREAADMKKGFGVLALGYFFVWFVLVSLSTEKKFFIHLEEG